ncbi:lipopolysaccharide export system permease protein [Fodinibius salinus]|uniref:Lipopolysaccharide export system permease protein n=1 Tax=Fodinibius salinus TaxID=860790 RepID=A0A5D3YLW5_9BACT|nr:LptF/LptG family permease [Fodinibius salinus]TYP94944.1 lipopolysaccharide export system permease protein [Fodinibius salinus]
MNLLPNKLQLDILRRHVGPFIFCFFTLMFLLLMQFLILYIDLLVGKGLPLGVIIELIVTNLASMVVLAMPMAVLVACLMAYGKFTELNELTAIRAAGVNPFHVISPVLTSGILLTIFLVWFSNDVLPDANQRARSLFIDIRLKKPGFDLKEDEFYDGIDNYTFLVDRITNESDSLHDVTIFQDPTKNKNKALIKAQKGALSSKENGQTLTLFLENGSILRKLERNKGRQQVDVYETTSFDRYRISFDLSELAFSRSNPQDRSRNDRTMNIQAMASLVDSLDQQIKEKKQKLYTKHSFSITSDTSKVFKRELEYRNEQEIQPPVKTDWVGLKHLTSKTKQERIKSITLSSLRTYRTSLNELITNTDWRIEKIARYLVEIHKKFSIPFACIVFVLLGAPIGMYTRKGNLGYAALIGTVFLTIYWISIIQGEKLADRLFITPFTGMWLSNIVLGLIGTYLTIRICSSFKISNFWKNRD